MSASRRNLVIFLSLLAILALAFPIISSLLGDLIGLAAPTDARTPVPTGVAIGPAPTRAVIPLVPSMGARTATRTRTPTPSATSTPTFTATATPSSTPTLTPSSTPTPTPRPRVYLVPFVQVFAIGQSQSSPSTEVQLYEGGTDVFEQLEVRGAFVRLQVVGGEMNFWTASGNISVTPPTPAQYDYSVRGKTATLVGSSVFACAHNDRPTLAFGACQQLNNVSTAVLVARIAAGASPIYLAQLGGAQYIIPASAIAAIQ